MLNVAAFFSVHARRGMRNVREEDEQQNGPGSELTGGGAAHVLNSMLNSPPPADRDTGTTRDDQPLQLKDAFFLCQ